MFLTTYLTLALERNLADNDCRELMLDVDCISISFSRESKPLRKFSVGSAGVKLRFSNVSFKNFSCKKGLN